MRIGILGTGGVGQTLAGKLAELGHDVMVGTRDVARILAQTEPLPTGALAFAAWLQRHTGVHLGSYADAAQHGEVIFNATNGAGSLAALELTGEANLAGKILIDISNPLDFSQGMPPTLFVSNSDSLGEQIQRALPRTQVVKTLNTVTASLMIEPERLAGGDHTLFVSGNDATAKVQVAEWLSAWFGWKHVIDLGDISTARGTEMYLPLWLRLWGALGTGVLNVKVVR